MIQIRVLSENVRYLTCHVKENRPRKNKKSILQEYLRKKSAKIRHFSLSLRGERQYILKNFNSNSANSSPTTSSSYPVEIFSQLCGFQRQLSSRYFQSAAWPLTAAIQSQSSVSCVASSGSYPVDIFSRLRGL